MSAENSIISYASASRFPQQIVEKFFSNIILSKNDDCWLWCGRMNPKTGYGEFSCRAWLLFPGRTGHICLAHRVAYLFHHGAIDQGKLICHSCDVRHCMNWDHLFPGTHADNSHDMHIKGRGLNGNRNWTRKFPELVKKGENHPMAKLADDQTDEIASLYLQGNISQREIANIYQVSQYAIWRIVNRRRKRNVKF